MARDCVLSSNNATRGAAARVSGGVLAFLRTAIERNTATEAGGALAVSGGLVLLANQTTLRDNEAPTGATMLLETNASVAYGLPAPLSHWIAGSFVCEKFRVPCGVGDSACNEDPSAQPLLASQPCDWEVNGEFILGLTVSIGRGEIEGDYPFACRADGLF